VFDRLAKFFRRQPDSKSVAKARLQLILIQDRAGIEPGILEMLKDDLIDMLSKYFEINQSGLEMNLHREEQAMALVANVPITSMRMRPSDEWKRTKKANDAPQELSVAKANA